MSIFPMYPRNAIKLRKPITISTRRPADKRFSENYSFPVQNYADYCGDTVYVAYRDLIIDEGVTLTTENPCKGLYIYCDGDCTINGIISMTARGAKFDPQGEGFGCKPRCDAFLNITFSYPYTAEQLEDYIRRYIQSIAENGMPQAVWPSYIINNIYEIPANEEDLATVPAVGANGGATSYGAANPGSNGTDRKSGGGGSGARYSSGSGGAGGNGTSYSGGSGGGGGADGTGGAGSSIGGAGGGGSNSNAGGGAGNPSGNYGTGGGQGTGGLIILVVRGNLTIGTNGKIESKGSAGKDAGGFFRAGGGGSGGGSINIFYGGTYTKNGNVLATGGAGGIAGGNGGKGGDGCITEQQI
jgi:hypothetical protein